DGGSGGGVRRSVRAGTVPSHAPGCGRGLGHDRRERLACEELTDEHVCGDPKQRKEDLEENPGRLAVRTDDPRIGPALDGPQVQPDPIPKVRATGLGLAHSNPLPTMLMKTSSRVGSDFCSAWTFFPCDVIVLMITE